MVLVAAMVNRVFSSSMEVGVRVEEEDVATGQRHHCCSAYLTFVNLRAQQTKGALPRVVPDSPHHHTVFEQALTRRQHRLHAKQRARVGCVVPSWRAVVAQHREKSPSITHHHHKHQEAKADGEPNSGALPMLLPVTHAESAPSIPPLVPPPSPAAGPRGIAPSFTRAYMTQLIMPQHANSLGITFGGQVMKYVSMYWSPCSVVACGSSWTKTVPHTCHVVCSSTVCMPCIAYLRRWMEQCAYISGSRISRGAHLVTASMDSIAFSNPTKVGDVLYVTAQVSAIFGSSLEVMISVHGESPHQGAMFKCGDAFATIVSVDARGDPVEVPFALEPGSEAEAACMEVGHLTDVAMSGNQDPGIGGSMMIVCAQAALARREDRLQLRCTLQELRSQRTSLDGPQGGNTAYVHVRCLCGTCMVCLHLVFALSIYTVDVHSYVSLHVVVTCAGPAPVHVGQRLP